MTRIGAVHTPSWVATAVAAVAVVARNPSLVRLQLAYLASFTASGMVQVAVSVEAFQRGGAMGVALITLAQTLPAVVVVPIVSGLGDRASRRALFGLAVAIGGVSAALLGVVMSGSWPVGVLYLLAAVFATSSGVAWALVGAMLPTLARMPDELVAANVASTATEGAGGLLGPLLAALLLVTGGVAVISVVAAIGFLVAVVSAASVRPPAALAPALTVGRASGVRALLAEATEGTRTLGRLPGPRLITIAMFIQMLVRGALSVLIVVLAIDTLGLGDPGVGVLTAAIGVGGLAGAAVAMPLATGRPLGPMLGISLILWGLPIAMLAVSPGTPIVLLLLAIVGVASALVDVAGFGLLQGTVPDRARTGAMGAVEGAVALGLGLGGLLASGLLAVLDTPFVLLTVGLLLPAFTVLRWTRWGRLDDELLVSREQVERLRDCRMFAPLSLAQLEQLAGGTTREQYDAGTEIIREGDRGDAFYVLIEGQVEVQQAGRHLRTMGPGEGFGELALLRGVARSATVTAVAPTTAYRVDAVTFVSAVTGNPASGVAAQEISHAFDG